ncbi:MAG: DUF2802 domain-containing protein [Gammaproteobacteria bacterium]|nr:DUF2802 domain-containing protein [Gammaproteobacteria bacterium]
MMTIITMTILILISLALLITGAQLYQLQKQFLLQQESLEKLSSEYKATSSTNFGFGNRLVDIERKLINLKTQHQDIVEFGSEDKYQKRTFKQASHLAQMGASVDELRQSCELSHGEAELLAHMNLN